MNGPLTISDVLPLKSQYHPGEPVVVRVELALADARDPDGAADSGTADTSPAQMTVEVRHLAEVLRTLVVQLPAEGRTVDIDLGSFQLPPDGPAYAGFGVDVTVAGVGGGRGAAAAGSFDIAADPRATARYGFLAEFDEGYDQREVDWLRRLHINLVQFYDWAYRHHELVPPAEEYRDLMGKRNLRSVVRCAVEQCHEAGMLAVAYGAVYAAGSDFAEAHPEWRLYDAAGEPYRFIDRFQIMNLAEGCGWRDHIIGQYRQAMERLGFDGIHLDTYGFPKVGWGRAAGPPDAWPGTEGQAAAWPGPGTELEQTGARRDDDEVGGRRAGAKWAAAQRVDHAEVFPAFIRDVRERLNGQAVLIFNNVGNWPTFATAPAPQDAVYVEVWEPYVRYGDLREIVRDALQAGDGKPVILAAYIEPYKGVLEGSCSREGALWSLLLTIAAVSSLGAQHLALGGDHRVLTQGYYVDSTELMTEERRVVAMYYDFLVRYEELLFDRHAREVTRTHAGGDNREYRFSGAPVSATGEPGRLWTLVTERADRTVIRLVNLCGNDDLWNEPKKPPEPVGSLTVEVLVFAEVRGVWATAPDMEHGRPLAIDYRLERSPEGVKMVFATPRVFAWMLVWIELGPSAPGE